MDFNAYLTQKLNNSYHRIINILPRCLGYPKQMNAFYFSNENLPTKLSLVKKNHFYENNYKNNFNLEKNNCVSLFRLKISQVRLTGTQLMEN